MSALGHQLPRRFQILVSALPPKADINRSGQHVRFGPTADIGPIIQLQRRRASGTIARPGGQAP
jgi:hypothetical protein